MKRKSQGKIAKKVYKQKKGSEAAKRCERKMFVCFAKTSENKAKQVYFLLHFASKRILKRGEKGHPSLDCVSVPVRNATGVHSGQS
jgi:hypothetical protein